MEDSLYRDIILDHWKHPHNAGVVEGADFDGHDVNVLCGDEIRMTGKVKDGVIQAIKFTGAGCAISQASASMLTDEIVGKRVEEIGQMKPESVLELLGVELTPARLKCALLGFTTLKKGLRSVIPA